MVDVEGLRLYAQGSAFRDDAFDLRTLEGLLTNYRQVIDRSIPILLGRRTLSDSVKRDLRYEVTVKGGSLDVLLEFVIQNQAPLALIAFSDGGHALAHTLSKLLRDVIRFRHAVTKILENGMEPKIVLDQSVHIDNSVNVSSSGNTINSGRNVVRVSHPNIVYAATETKPPLDRFINSVDGAGVKSIELQSEDISIRLSESDRAITGSEREELPNTVEVIGTLDMVAFSTHRGNLISGGRRYPVTWNENIRSQIKAIADKEGARFIVKPWVDRKSFQDEPLGFHIERCFNPQSSLQL